ncbi:major capsid protein [Paenibacillus sp. USDA918EY]|uniref:major capsid protein n=1 Tax=Paenibacillus sp. USDA918EY TaxID=2689575 RepID=UPI0019172B3C|nr:major capsid protein [Paenibacillus sp. USDA918EY]
MAMNLELYKTTTMLAAIEKTMPLRKFFTKTFFPGVTTFVTEKVIFDYKKGKRPMAPFVAPRVGGITVSRDGYQTKEYTAPKIAPQRILTVDDLMTRGMGENVFSQRTPAQRQAELLAKDLSQLEDMTARRIEWMARELFLGKPIIVKGYIDKLDSEYVEDQINFGFDNKVTLAGADKWSDPGSEGKKLENLKKWRMEVIKKSGTAPTMVIFGQNAWESFRKDPEIMKLVDQQNATLALMNPSVVDIALTYCGKLPGLGLELYTYDDWFIDDDGVEQPYIPENAVILCRPNLGSFSYGAVTQMEADGQFHTYEGTRVPKSWSDQNSDARMIRLSSRPIPIPEDVDGWFVAEVQ